MILSPVEVLNLVPQQPPFRFIDSISAITEETIRGTVRFDASLDFYRGHFPGNPITPGVILLEAMCQVGVVAHGIYLFAATEPGENIRDWVTLFSDAEKTEFFSTVMPGERLDVLAEKIFWRRKKLRSRIELRRTDGTLVASTLASGVGVKNAK